MPFLPKEKWDHLPGTKGAWAFDFIVGTDNFPIVAAQGGEVIGLENDSSIQCQDQDTEKSPISKEFKNCWAQANFVLIADDDGSTAALYMHLLPHSIKVNLHQHIDQGTLLGLAGTTGWSTGVHLHFQVEAIPSAAAQHNQPLGWWWTYSQQISFSNPEVLAKDADGIPLTGQTFAVSSHATSPTSSATPTPQQTGAVTEFSLPTANSRPNAIVAGPDGNLWFTQSGGGNVDANPSGGCSCVGSIGRLTPDGSVKVFYDASVHNTGDGSFQPEGITIGPNGNLWFVMATENGLMGYVGQITPGGSITESAVYSADGGITIGTIASIAIGSDGKLWFTAGGGVGRVEPSGDIQPFPLSDPSTSVGGIALDPDGNLWFSESTGIGRITPDGTMTQFPIDPSLAAPAGITRGPDGSMWFAEQNAIGRITPDGTISQFPLSQPNSHPGSITTGPDGNLWFTEAYGIGRITPSGQVTVFPVSAQFNGVASDQNLVDPFEGITSGPNGNLWFIDPASNKIGEITP